MTVRDRAHAEAVVAKWTSSFCPADGDAPTIPTAELRERLQRGGRTVLVDVRCTEEQHVSVIPTAITKEAFEAEVLPELKARPDPEVLVVPYCTAGYRSGLYCRELIRNHGLSSSSVRNGEGVILWTFDGGRLARPRPRGAAAPGPSAAVCGVPAPEAAGRSEVERFCGSALRAPHAVSGNWEPMDAELVTEVHVYGKNWDCAAPGFQTVYFTNTQGVSKAFSGLCTGSRGKTAVSVALWAWALLHFYIFFTPACGVMYNCGCRLALSKWGQVERCNVFDHSAGAHRCPWCSCSGLGCIFVGYDTKAFKGVFLFDTLPDGFFVTLFTLVVLRFVWRATDRAASSRGVEGRKVAAAKASMATVWFVAYCLAFGAIFWAAHWDYPHFLGFTREVAGGSRAAVAPQPVPGRFLMRPDELSARLSSVDVLDARAASSGLRVIPGARLAPWQAFAVASGGAERSVLKPPAELLAMLQAARVNGSRPVLVYGDWDRGWGEEGRLFWMLDYLGFPRGSVKCLQGGLQAWQAAGHAVEPLSGSPIGAAGNLTTPAVGLPVDPSTVVARRRATTTDVLNLLLGGDLVLLDTRDKPEYVGGSGGDPYGAARSGHIPGATLWTWKSHVFAPVATGAPTGTPPELLRCSSVLDGLPPEAASQEVVAYCTGGIRSGFAYFVLLGCGLEHIRNYDGSWWAWAADPVLPCAGEGSDCKAEEVAGTSAPFVAGGGGGSGGGWG